MRKYTFEKHTLPNDPPVVAAASANDIVPRITVSEFRTKEYVVGTAYTNGTPSVSGSITYTVVRGVLVPYQTLEGSWRLRFNIYGTVASGARTSYTLTFSGVTFKNVANYYQACDCYHVGTEVGICYASPNTGDVTVNHVSNTVTFYGFSGDVELNGKPTWAD